MDALVATWSAQIRSAGAAGRALWISAGGTKAFYGGAVVGERLDPRGYHGVVEYEPSELVVTVRAGTRLADLEALLAAHGQMLAFEPPHFGDAATVGGMVAAGLAGPRRLAQSVGTGAVRDSVLGVRLIDGRGEVLAFGGRVVKNVAGYDVSRVLAGSLGTLGLLLEISLKVVPRPVCEATLVYRCSQATALTCMQDWMRQPLPVSATAYAEGLLQVRLSGGEAAVAEALQVLPGDRVPVTAAVDHWMAVRELAFARTTAAALWRLGLPASVPPLALPGTELVEWNGQRRWLVTDAPARVIRARVRALGGHATRFRGGDPTVAPFPASSPVVAQLDARVRAAFDPQQILNPGRWHADATD